MGRKKLLILHMSVFGGLLTLLWLMLVCAAAIPNHALKDNMERSAGSYREKEAFSFENGRRWNGIADNYADTILLNVSWNMGQRDSPVLGSLDTWYYDGEEMGENVGLYLSVAHRNVEPNVDYSRYWHGTAVFLRLLHMFTDVESIKVLGFAVILALSCFTGFLLTRYGHPELTAAMFLSMGAVQIWNVRLSLEYEPTFVICFLLCPVYLWTERNRPEYLTCLTVAGGVMAAFFDFLTTETVVLLFPLILVVAVRGAEGRLGGFRDNIRLLVLCVLCWLWGYGGTFLVKWTAASAVTGENKFLAAFSSVGERVAGNLQGAAGEGFVAGIPMAVAANFTVLFGGDIRVDPARTAAGLAAVCACLGSALYLFYKNKGNTVALKLLGVLGSLVILRYIVLSNHSYLHEFFTYRALMSTVMAVLSAMTLCMELPHKMRRRLKRGR